LHPPSRHHDEFRFRETHPSNSADISVLFGYFLSQRAARMNPIKALRHE